MQLTVTMTSFIGATVFSRSEFGQSMGPIFFRIVACSGAESSLLQCTRTTYRNDVFCSRARGAGVRCEGKQRVYLL